MGLGVNYAWKYTPQREREREALHLARFPLSPSLTPNQPPASKLSNPPQPPPPSPPGWTQHHLHSYKHLYAVGAASTPSHNAQ